MIVADGDKKNLTIRDFGIERHIITHADIHISAMIRFNGNAKNSDGIILN